MTTTSPTIPWTDGDRFVGRTRADDARAVPAALRSEWIKLGALRANKVILGLTAGVGATIAGGLAATATIPRSPPASCSSTRCRWWRCWPPSPASSCSRARPSTAPSPSCSPPARLGG